VFLYQLSNARITFSEIWYVYHGTLAKLNVVVHELFLTFFVTVYVSALVAGQRLKETCSHGKKELVEASFSVLSVLHQRNVGK
jgi:hypothetical protein